MECKECGMDFVQNRPFQVFCNDRCKGAYHRRRYRQQAVEEAEERREARMNGGPQERGEASEVLVRVMKSLAPKMVRRRM
jgi:hypothetical protein